MNNIEEDKVKAAIQNHGICVLIPTYNNAGTLSCVLSDVLKYSSDIIVVNDGSTDNTSDILDRFKGKIHIVSYSKTKVKAVRSKKGSNMPYQRDLNTL